MTLCSPMFSDVDLSFDEIRAGVSRNAFHVVCCHFIVSFINSPLPPDSLFLFSFLFRSSPLFHSSFRVKVETSWCRLHANTLE